MEYGNTNPGNGIEYAEKALNLAVKLNWKYGISDAYKCLGNNYYGKSDYNKALAYYQKSFSLAMRIFEMTKSFPKEEMYSLTDQIRRSSRSVPANIAEAYRKRVYPKSFHSKLTDLIG